MSRDIKFKCYKQDGKTGEIYSAIHETVVKEYSVSAVSTQSNQNKVIGYCRFTGRKDKSGREIYEGDLIRVLDRDWPSGNGSREYMISISAICEVVFDEAKFCLAHRSGRKFFNDDLAKDYGRDIFEVLGNIYENPELLQP